MQAHAVRDATWYSPRDVSNLEQAVRAGAVQRVMFLQTADFLGLLWDEVLTPEVWQAPAVSVVSAGSGDALTAAQITDILAAWQTWRHRRRRQRAIAGLILSAVAIAAAWLLLALVR